MTTTNNDVQWTDNCPDCNQEIQNIWSRRPPGAIYLHCPHCQAKLQIRIEHQTIYHLEPRGGGATVGANTAITTSNERGGE